MQTANRPKSIDCLMLSDQHPQYAGVLREKKSMEAVKPFRPIPPHIQRQVPIQQESLSLLLYKSRQNLMPEHLNYQLVNWRALEVYAT